MKYSKDTFCSYPFTYISTTNSGIYRACCESLGTGISAVDCDSQQAWNSNFYKQLRSDLINGIKNPHCSRCWNVEQHNGTSTRQKQLQEYTDEQIIELVRHTKVDGHLDLMPITFEFKVGNLCNLKCIMCTQMESSQHESEVKFMKKSNHQLPSTLDYIENRFIDQGQVYRYQQDQQIQLLDNFKKILPTLKLLMIVGGEPLINPLTKQLLDLIVDSGYEKNISLTVISNLYQTQFDCIETAKQFLNFRLLCSIDHIDPYKFNYIRYPARYEEVYNNFQTLIDDETIDLEISSTFNIFNIFDMPSILEEFNKWSEKKNVELKLQLNFVDEPRYFSIQYLSDNNKKRIPAMIDGILLNMKESKLFIENKNLISYLDQAKSFASSTPADYDTIIPEQQRVLNLYDNIRGTNYKKLFPHLII